MFDYLKSLASRLRRRWGGPFPPPFVDPEVGVREPRKRGPGGRSSSAAVPEPFEGVSVSAHGSRDSARRYSAGE